MSFANPPALRETYNRLAERVIFVTGASSGIGAAAVRLFAKEGAQVIAAARRTDRVVSLADELNSQGLSVTAIECDVTSEPSVAGAVDAAVAKYGRLDGAFNCAGVGAVWVSVADADVADFDRVVATNLRGVFVCMKHEIRAILAMAPKGQDGRRRASIVNVSSIGGLLGHKSNAIYAASKFGLEGVTRCAAMDYAAMGVRVNAIAPGATRSEMFDDWLPTEEAKAKIAKMAPMNYVAEPDDMARAALWLLSEESRWTTGIVLPCEGGASSGRAPPPEE